MKISTEPYLKQTENLPTEGQHITGHQQEDLIVVYQAYNHRIADFAIENQCFGGSNFSFNRMSWIKPNFLWMMYRCGWAQKENQERVLAIWIKKDFFEYILSQAVFSAFKDGRYSSYEQWRQELELKEVRLQWDPDHDPFGKKLKRRAIQLGLKGKALESFAKESIIEIEDITEFVLAQRLNIVAGDLSGLQVPVERVYEVSHLGLRNAVGADTY